MLMICYRVVVSFSFTAILLSDFLLLEMFMLYLS